MQEGHRCGYGKAQIEVRVGGVWHSIPLAGLQQRRCAEGFRRMVGRELLTRWLGGCMAGVGSSGPATLQPQVVNCTRA